MADVKVGELEHHTNTLPGEQVAARYNVRKLEPKFPIAVTILMALILLLALVTPTHAPTRLPMLAIGLAGIVGCVVAYAISYRARGVVFMTNRRVVYVEYGKGAFRERNHVASVDLAYVNGISALTQDGKRTFLGIRIGREKKNFYLQVDTRAWKSITIGATSQRPGMKIFEPDAGALQAVQEMGAKVRQLHAELTTSQQRID